MVKAFVTSWTTALNRRSLDTLSFGGGSSLLDPFGHKIVKGCLHVRFCALLLTSWSMCLTDESIDDKLQWIISGYLSTDCHEFITYTRITITTCNIARVNCLQESQTKPNNLDRYLQSVNKQSHVWRWIHKLKETDLSFDKNIFVSHAGWSVSYLNCIQLISWLTHLERTSFHCLRA